MTLPTSFGISEDVVRLILADVDTLLSLKADILIRHREYVQLVNLTVDPCAYDDPEVFF